MHKKLKKKLKSAFDSPEPSRKKEFLSNISYPKTSNLEFFVSQICYIRKRFWCLSVLIAVTLVWFIEVFGTSVNTIVILSSFLPFLVVLSVAEISKSISCNMAEMEICCKYNLSKITLVRLFHIGNFHFIILLCVVMIFKNGSCFNSLQFLLYSVTPLVLCAYLSLYISNHFHANDITYICAGVVGVISGSVCFLAINFEIIYSQKYEFIWRLIFIMIFILLWKETRNFIKRSEEVQWNLPLIN